MAHLKHIKQLTRKSYQQGRGTSVENLSIFVEKCLFPELFKTETGVQDTSEMLNFIDILNDSNMLMENCMLVSFNVVTCQYVVSHTYFAAPVS